MFYVGLSTWLFSRAITLKEINLANSSPIIYLDSRTKAEFDISHISNSRWIGDRGELAINYINSSNSVIIYCTIGYRSGKVVNHLRQKNHSNVYNLEGGILNWVSQDLPIYSNGVRTRYLHTYNWFRSLFLSKKYKAIW